MALMGSALALPLRSFTASAGSGVFAAPARTIHLRGQLSREFVAAAEAIARRGEVLRQARITLAPLRPQYVKAVSEARKSMGWYFRRPEVVAEQTAKIYLRAAIEAVLRMRALRRADAELQLALLAQFEHEFGDSGGVTRRQFGPRIAEARRCLGRGSGETRA